MALLSIGKVNHIWCWLMWHFLQRQQFFFSFLSLDCNIDLSIFSLEWCRVSVLHHQWHCCHKDISDLVQKWRGFAWQRRKFQSPCYCRNGEGKIFLKPVYTLLPFIRFLHSTMKKLLIFVAFYILYCMIFQIESNKFNILSFNRSKKHWNEQICNLW